MRQAWQAHQAKKIVPQLQILEQEETLLNQSKPRHDNDSIIHEESSDLEAESSLAAEAEDDSDYNIASEISFKEQGALFEGEMDVNEVNFNLVKGSKAFKPAKQSGFVIDHSL